MTATPSEKAFYDELVRHRLILPLGVPGIFGRGPVFEDVLGRFNALVSRSAEKDGAEPLHFPPVIPRRLMEQSGFLNSFPHLAGTLFSFEGNDLQHQELKEKIAKGEDWSGHQKMTDVALTSAACYPVYPTFSGELPPGGRLIDLTSYCFRHEPSPDPARLQMFRMREFIRLGAPDVVLEWRETWVKRGSQLLNSIGLPVDAVPASDPFFGRSGRMLAANQKEQKLKFEVVIPIANADRPTAIMSFNYHQDHFSSKFKILQASGEIAHTACLGFGVERITMAMFKTHGFVPAEWPKEVRQLLWP
jgi:seryl-tRNA synthetase